MKKLKNIQSAVQQNNCHSNPNLSQSVITTAKIGQIFPIYHEALVPGDKVHVNTSTFCRFAPLSVPAYVRLNMRTMTLFVPYHQLADGCESFFGNQKKFRSHFNHIPVITMNTLSEYLRNRASLLADASFTSDLKTLSISGSGASQQMVNGYYNLTALGNYVIKVLRGLGYNVGREIMASTNSAPALNFKMNALPLLAWAHGYNSYMSYSPQQNTSALSQTLEAIKRQASAGGYELTTTDLSHLLDDILLTYDDNLFTMAWQNPYGNQGSFADAFNTTGFDTSGANSELGANALSGAYIEGMSEDLNAAQVRMLLKFDDYFRRSNYGGSKDIEQIYSRFGVKIDDFRTRYPYFLRESSSPVSIGDVTSTSDTAVYDGEVTGGVLGSYAGKAIADGGTSFEFECHDYGMLITYAWFAPVVKYYNGFDKECLRTEPFDFYTPELDAGFADTIRREEFRGTDAYMYSALPSEGHEYQLTPYASSQGNIPLYSQYLFGKDYINGDFRRFESFESWHFGRNVTHKELLPQSSSLIYMSNIGTEYERIFNVIDPELVDADTIYLDVFNDVHSYRPMKDYTGKVGLGDGDIDVGINGSQLN